VRVMPRIALILHVRRRNRDPPRPLLRRLVNLVVGLELPANFSAITFVSAAVKVVLPWST